LAQEPEVSEKVLMGALAGYLLVGLTAGLLFSAVETVVPGSFRESLDKRGLSSGSEQERVPLVVNCL